MPLYYLVCDLVMLAALPLLLFVVVGYVLLPFFVISRPQFSSSAKNKVFTACLWLVGLLPPTGLLITYVVEQTIPGSRGSGGEPGLNAGWDSVPAIIGFLLAPFPQFILWWLFYDKRKERSQISFE